MFQLLGTAQKEQVNKTLSIPYTWENVQVVVGGFVDGIIFHPVEKGLRYCRTDMGGTYTTASGSAGAILVSRDRGKSFIRINMPFKMGGNENGRGNGERMVSIPMTGT